MNSRNTQSSLRRWHVTCCTYALLGSLAHVVGCARTDGTAAGEPAGAAGIPPAYGGQSGDEGRDDRLRASTPAIPTTPAPPAPVATDLDAAEFEFRGQSFIDFLADFGGQRTGQWQPELDSNYPSLQSPAPGPTTVTLTVDGLPTNLQAFTQSNGSLLYTFMLPLRLQTSDDTLDVAFTAAMTMDETGRVWTYHQFSLSELGATLAVRTPADQNGESPVHLSARLWPGGSAGTLQASFPIDLSVTPALPSTSGLQVAAPPTPAPPPPDPIPPPAGTPDPWLLEATPGSLLSWPDGMECGNPSGRDYERAGLTPAAVLEFVSHLDALTLARAAAAPDAGASTFTLEVVSARDDVCVSTESWRGSTLDRLAVTVDMHVTHAQSGLDLTLPVEVAALHDGGTIDTVYFASAVDHWVWMYAWNSPVLSGVNLEERTGLTGAANGDTVFPLLTGRVRPSSDGVDARGQVLIAVPSRDMPGSVTDVTDLNLSGAEESEVERLFHGVDYDGIEQVLFDGVWSNGGSEP